VWGCVVFLLGVWCGGGGAGEVSTYYTPS